MVKQMSLAINKDILEDIARDDLSLTQYTILVLYRTREVYNRELLDTLITERNGLTERFDFSALCRKGYLEKLNTSIFQSTDNYKLTAFGQDF